MHVKHGTEKCPFHAFLSGKLSMILLSHWLFFHSHLSFFNLLGVNIEEDQKHKMK